MKHRIGACLIGRLMRENRTKARRSRELERAGTVNDRARIPAMSQRHPSSGRTRRGSFSVRQGCQMTVILGVVLISLHAVALGSSDLRCLENCELRETVLAEVPPEWGELVDFRATAVHGLMAAAFSDLATDPAVQESLHRWDQSVDGAQALVSKLVSEEQPIQIVSLWYHNGHGVHLQRAVAVFLRNGSIKTQSLLSESDSSPEARLSLSQWRQALVLRINDSHFLATSELAGEIVRYTLLSEERSLLDLWVSTLLQWGCEGSDNKGECNECCDDTADSRINWGCGLASKLGGIGGCLVLGGPTNPFGCLVGAATAGYLIQSGCVSSINRHRKGCKYSCEYQFTVKLGGY